MEDQKVTLKIFIEKENLLDYRSDIRIFNIANEQLRQFKKIDFSKNSQIVLGNLNELTDSYIIIDTFARKTDNNCKSAMITYEVQYGTQIVERTTVESEFIDRAVVSLGFRFRFCPRHPFC